MSKRTALLFLALVTASPWAAGQDYQSMQQAMERAQAEASKPGDENLTCEQLGEQLMTLTQNPEFRSQLDAAAVDAQKRQEAMKAAKATVAMQTFRTVMMATMPGMAMPGMASAQAQAQAQGMAGMKDTQARMQQAGKMMTLMPMMMRGQRVIELASAKSCEWAKSAGPPQ